MAIAIGPKIVESNLVLALDAANIKSYPGVGITWTNSIDRVNNANLAVNDNVYRVYDLLVADYILPNSDSSNFPSFNSSNFGSINFDGNDDYLDFFTPSLGTTTTIEIWMRLGENYQEKIIFGWLYYCVWCKYGNMGYNTGNGDVFGISAATVNSLNLIGNFKHYIFEMNEVVSYTNNKIYINSVLQTLSNLGSNSQSVTNRTFNGGSGRLCAWRSNVSYPMPMDCASFKVYNRALTAAEISQNFNALRGRFGI